MAVIRVEKNKNYVVLAKYHMYDRRLSAKTIGIMTVMLSLPDNWKFSAKGLASIIKDGVQGVTSALKELEKYGYLLRKKIRNPKGQITETEYTIYEMPLIQPPDISLPFLKNLYMEAAKKDKTYICNTGDTDGINDSCSDNPYTDIPYTDNPFEDNPDTDMPYMDNTCEDNTDKENPCIYNSYVDNTVMPVVEKPYTEKPVMGKPDTDKPDTENRTQINNNKLNNNILNNNILNINQSIYPPNDLVVSESQIKKDIDGINDIINTYRQIFKKNIEYNCLCSRYGSTRIDEIVELMLEPMCTKGKYMRIGSNQYLTELVKSHMLMLNSSHIEYIFECLDKTTNKIHNIKAYMLSSLFNAPETIDAHYINQVKHDLYGGGNYDIQQNVSATGG